MHKHWKTVVAVVCNFFERILLKLVDFHIPDFDVSVLAGRGDGLVVDPGDGVDLALHVGRGGDGVLLGGRHVPYNDGTVEATGGNEARVGRPGNAVDLKIKSLKLWC